MLQKSFKHKNSLKTKKSTLSKSIKGIVLSFLFLFSVSTAQAQELELTPTVGYFWAGKLRTYDGELRLGEGISYGLTLNYALAPGTLFEAFWTISKTDATFFEYGFNDFTDGFNLTTNYIQFGVIQEMNYGEAFRPYGVFTAGTTIFSPEFSGTYWQFSLGLGGGLKYYVSDRIGIRVQGRFLLPVYFRGGGIWCGTGGCGYGLSAGTAIAQGDVTAGLIFVLR
jgi:Outer membrane protein beta-barrel domain